VGLQDIIVDQAIGKRIRPPVSYVICHLSAAQSRADLPRNIDTALAAKEKPAVRKLTAGFLFLMQNQT